MPEGGGPAAQQEETVERRARCVRSRGVDSRLLIDESVAVPREAAGGMAARHWRDSVVPG